MCAAIAVGPLFRGYFLDGDPIAGVLALGGARGTGPHRPELPRRAGAGRQPPAARTDELTGLPNRRSVFEALDAAEDQDTVDALASLGRDLVQGYHLSPPLPPDQLWSWLAERTAAVPVA